MISILPKGSLKSFFIIFFCLIFFTPAYAAQQTNTPNIITEAPPPIPAKIAEEEKIEVFADSYYEPSDVAQGSRKGSWKEVTDMAGLSKGNLKGYFSVSQLRRFEDTNYTANFGAYLMMKNSSLHFETGFAWDRTFIYRLQDIIEYSHKLYNYLYWQLGYTYRAYPTGDTHLIYPGLIYYFGDSYISANYGASIIASRGAGNMGTVKLNIALNKYVSWWWGGAYGQWLYDIDGLPASQEVGYILFSGFTYNINKWLTARIGYSYGTEKPKFLKRNLMYGLSLKF